MKYGTRPVRPIVGVIEATAESHVELPTYQTDGAAGMDLRAAENVTIPPGGRALVKTGIRLAIPEGFEGQVRSRSGLSLKQGLIVLNAPGTIDSDYRGDIGVILANLGTEEAVVNIGDRIAQLVFAQVARVELEKVEELDDTNRGRRGFGSTGRQ
jgi:dUTP pyrophosphatase